MRRCGLLLQMVVSVCLLVSGHNHEPYKTTELIDASFGMWTRVGPRKPRNMWGLGFPGVMRQFGGHLPSRCET